jgi:hypothetical protein
VGMVARGLVHPVVGKVDRGGGSKDPRRGAGLDRRDRDRRVIELGQVSVRLLRLKAVAAMLNARYRVR